MPDCDQQVSGLSPNTAEHGHLEGGTGQVSDDADQERPTGAGSVDDARPYGTKTLTDLVVDRVVVLAGRSDSARKVHWRFYDDFSVEI